MFISGELMLPSGELESLLKPAVQIKAIVPKPSKKHRNLEDFFIYIFYLETYWTVDTYYVATFSRPHKRRFNFNIFLVHIFRLMIFVAKKYMY
jgi:hypothetical protein